MKKTRTKTILARTFTTIGVVLLALFFATPYTNDKAWLGVTLLALGTLLFLFGLLMLSKTPKEKNKESLKLMIFKSRDPLKYIARDSSGEIFFLSQNLDSVAKNLAFLTTKKGGNIERLEIDLAFANGRDLIEIRPGYETMRLIELNDPEKQSLCDKIAELTK